MWSQRFSSVFQFLTMLLWLLLSLTALAECNNSCPPRCSCFRLPSGVEVSCSHFSFSHSDTETFPPNTTRLSIQSSHLGSITATHLSVLPLLNNLQLYGTNLTGLPSDLLSPVPDLNTLDLTGNRLVHLPSNIFNHTSLRNLVMKDNLLEEVHPEWFPINSSITWLDLSGNGFTKVSASLFQRLKHLQNLDLSDNNLQALHPDSFKTLHHLETLNLAGNKIISLEAGTFSSNQKLIQLFLQENHLQELPATIFQNLKHLELLLINQNQLQYLPTGLLDGRASSFRIILNGNPWKCDLNMLYLWKWLNTNSQDVLFLEEVTCNSPQTLKHQQVILLTDGQLVL